MIHVKPTPSIVRSLSISIAALLLSGAAALGQSGTAQAAAQNQTPQPKVSADRETDIGFSFYRAMNSATTANGVTQTPTDADGGMFEVRHIHSPLIGYEMTYSYNPADDTVAPAPAGSCGINCNTPTQKLNSKGSLVGLDWVISKKYGSLRPFFAGGLGFFIDEPSNSIYPINDLVRMSYLYGGGVDWNFMAHFGVRAQYRGFFYKVPNLSTLFPAQGVYTQTREPMGGIFYTF